MAPVEHENRPLMQEEKRLFRKRSIQIYAFWGVTGILLWRVHLMGMTAILISTFIAAAILMMIGA